jgi:hypothetical protein
MASDQKRPSSTSLEAVLTDNIHCTIDSDTRNPFHLDGAKMHGKRVNHRSSHSADSVMDHSFYRNKDGKERQRHADQQSNEYKPLLPQTTDPDTLASQIFTDNKNPGKEVFRGRASFSGDEEEEEFAGRSIPSSTGTERVTRRFSKISFEDDHCPPLAEKAPFKIPTSDSGIFPLVIRLASFPDYSDEFQTAKNRSRSSTLSSEETGEEDEDLVAASYISILAMDEESTSLEINGAAYTVPTRSILRPNPDNDWEDLEDVIQPEFFASLWKHAASTAIKALGDQKLTGEKLCTSKSTAPTFRVAGDTDNFLSSSTSCLFIDTRVATALPNDISNITPSCTRRSSLYSLSGSTFVCHGAEMDGSTERSMGRTLCKRGKHSTAQA